MGKTKFSSCPSAAAAAVVVVVVFVVVVTVVFATPAPPTSSVPPTTLSDNDVSQKQFYKEHRRQQQDSDRWIADSEKSVSSNLTRTAARTTTTAVARTLALSLSTCPCNETKYCQPIETPFPKKELYGFSGGANDNGLYYNWTHITSVAWVSSDELMCRAHQNQARAIIAAPSFNLTQLSIFYVTDQQEGRHSTAYDDAISEWVNATLRMVLKRYRDGIVFDYEHPLKENSIEGEIYAKLIHATRDVFVTYNLSVTTCIPWSPDGIDGRYYPYKALENASDYLYVMDYDTQSQIMFGSCMANANAPYSGMIYGLNRYIDHYNISPNKLILGVPWYGYKYQCVQQQKIQDDNTPITDTTNNRLVIRANTTTMDSNNDENNNNDDDRVINAVLHDTRFCPISLVSFRGVNCSDAAGNEIAYDKIMQLKAQQRQVLKVEVSKQETITTVIQIAGPVRRDSYQDAAYMNIAVVSLSSVSSTSSYRHQQYEMFQYWYDDSISLRNKYSWASNIKGGSLRGVGPYTFQYLNTIHDTKESSDMWTSFDEFFIDTT